MTLDKSGNLILDRYLVVKRIGSGGMGEVYEAEDQETNEHVALKTFVVDQLSDANRVRLEREAEALSRFSHPNIVGFHTMKTEGRVLYCIMELIDGEPLSRLIERVCRLEKGLIPMETTLTVARSIASALQHAHQHNVLHRDVKPDNIIVEKGGRCVLTDFGLAKLKDMFSVTRVGQALGTVVYFAPEQMRGARRVNERTDVYQFGLTIYETIVGMIPFGDEPPLDALKKRVRDPIPSPRDLNKDCPLFLEKAVLRCLRPKAEERFPSMEDVVEALEFNVPKASRKRRKGSRRTHTPISGAIRSKESNVRYRKPVSDGREVVPAGVSLPVAILLGIAIVGFVFLIFTLF